MMDLYNTIIYIEKKSMTWLRLYRKYENYENGYDIKPHFWFLYDMLKLRPQRLLKL